ncbi:HAD family phosphatase [Sedimentibacter sp.]|uniref:HAD family hydrolase n=1 Tax=Sedimentibacter sp. TaxID=1960295 RepID=UPI0028AE3676|nr:HAD family phosphatase [Sedimentibacter sp.]
MKNLKFAIFDLDGTLLESMEAWNNLGRDLLYPKGVKVPDNLNDIIKPMTLRESAEYFQTAFKINLSVDEILNEMSIIMEAKYKNELELKPYVKEYLIKLKNNNVKMCIASATPLNMIEAALKRLDIIDFFEFISSCDEVGVGKNQPDIFYYAAKKLKAEPSEIAVYEDADFALITAKEANFYTIGVYDKFFHDKRKNIELISDIYIKSFKELI